MRTVVLPGVLAAALLFGACKRDSAQGMPPAQEWQTAGGGQGGMAVPPPTDPNDKADPRNQKSRVDHGGGMGGGGGGVPNGPMPDDDVHKNLGGGGGGNGLPPDHPPTDRQGGGDGQSSMMGTEDTGPRALEKLADGRYVLGPFTLAIPADWTVKPVTKGMRAAHIVLNEKPDEKAELIVFYQGEGGMGPVKDNLDRWAGQVKGTPKIEQLKFAGQDAHYMVISGDYKNETTGDAGKGQSVVGVILMSPVGPYYFKLVGASKTVDPQLAKVRAMFDSIKLK